MSTASHPDPKTPKIVLAADIGATNLRLRLTAVAPGQPKRHIAQSTFPSGDLAALRNNIEQFVSRSFGGARMRLIAAAIGVPGRISADRRSCAITYLDPDRYVQFDDMFRTLGVDRGILLNDLECGTHGVTCTVTRKFCRIGGALSRVAPRKNRFVLGMPGSGLGLGVYIQPVGPIPSEGGNAALVVNPDDAAELIIWNSLHLLNNQNRSDQSLPIFEDVVCGGGIVRMFRTLSQAEASTIDASAWLTALQNVPTSAQPKLIATWAREEVVGTSIRAHIAVKAFRYFGRYFARVMQGIAITLLPESIFIAGNIVCANRDLLEEDFMAAFQQHKSHGSYLGSLPVYVIENPDLNLDGATHVASAVENDDGRGGYQRR